MPLLWPLVGALLTAPNPLLRCVDENGAPAAATLSQDGVAGSVQKDPFFLLALERCGPVVRCTVETKPSARDPRLWDSLTAEIAFAKDCRYTLALSPKADSSSSSVSLPSLSERDGRALLEKLVTREGCFLHWTEPTTVPEGRRWDGKTKGGCSCRATLGSSIRFATLSFGTGC